MEKHTSNWNSYILYKDWKLLASSVEEEAGVGRKPLAFVPVKAAT